MTIQEFKAWFEGYTENIKGTPTQKQWARIQERVDQIDGRPLKQEIIYRYWPWYTYPTYLPAYSTASGTIHTNLTRAYTSLTRCNTATNNGSVYECLTDIGRQEALNG